MRFMKGDPQKIAVESEKAWLMRVCRNLAIDHLRRERRMTTIEDVEALMFAATIDESDLPQEVELKVMQTAMESLSPGQRESVRLRYQHDMSYREISGITGHSVSSVGVLLHEGLKRLRRILEKEPESGRTAKEVV